MIISIEDRDRFLTVESLLDGLSIDTEIDRESTGCGRILLRTRLLFEGQEISSTESFIDYD